MLGSGHDIIVGQGSNESIGFRGNGFIDLGAGNDTLIGFGGEQTVDGGTGEDIAIFSFDVDQITLGSNAANAITISDINSNNMLFTDVELFDFNGEVFTLNELQSMI